MSSDQQSNSESGAGMTPCEPKKKKIGTKDEVYHGLAQQTKGGLTPDGLILNKRNRVVSKKRSERGHKLYNDFVKKN